MCNPCVTLTGRLCMAVSDPNLSLSLIRTAKGAFSARKV